MNKLKKAFSLIEILISIAIITIIGVIATTSYLKGVDKANNSKIIGDLSSIENSLIVYSKQTDSLPMPLGNQKFYSKDSVYEHNYEDSFGVSGFFTSNILPKKYINFSPIDPKTNQYYGYGKTSTGNFFEVSGVIKEDNNYKSIVKGNWNGEYGPVNLIKEFSGPNFVENNSKNFFPYNPEQNTLTAKISTFSGEIFVNNNKIQLENINQVELFMGDNVKISTGGQANIYFSDGSFSIIGDNNSQTEIKLVNMNFKDDTNIFTNIKIALNMGSIWTKASKLSENSEFEIYSQDSVAAVRGTIFGIKKEADKTNIQLIKGIIEVNKINGNLSFEELINSIKNNSLSLQIINNGITIIKNEKSYLETTTQTKTIIIGNSTQTNGANENLINQKDIKTKQIITNGSEINQNIQLEINNIYNNKEKKEIGINLNKSIQNADYININGEKISNWQQYISGSLVVFTGRYLENNDFDIRFCNNFCTKNFQINLEKPIYFTSDYLKSIEFNGPNDKSTIQTNSGEITQNIDNCLIGYKVNFYQNEGYGCYDNEQKAIYIENMYKNILNRLPDKAGFENWYNQENYTTSDFITSAIEKNEPNLKYKCDELNNVGYYTLKLNGECIENNLFSSGYSVVAFAPFDVSGNTELYISGGVLPKTSGASICGLSCNYNINASILDSNTYNPDTSFTTYNKNNGIYVGYGTNLFYNGNSTTTTINPFKFGDKFAIELSIRGNRLKSTQITELILDTAFFRLNINGGEISLTNTSIPIINIAPKIDLSAELDKVEKNSFYRIIIAIEKQSGVPYNYNNNTYLSVHGNGIEKYSTGNYNTYVDGNMPDKSFVNISKIYDVIDYLKIYKK